MTLQVVGFELPVSVQLFLENFPPAPLSVQVTVPVGAVGVDDVSFTVAVKVSVVPITGLVELAVTTVFVGSNWLPVAVRVSHELVAGALFASPP